MSVNKYDGPTSIQSIYRTRDVKEPKAVKAVHKLVQPNGNPFIVVSTYTLYLILCSYKRTFYLLQCPILVEQIMVGASTCVLSQLEMFLEF